MPLGLLYKKEQGKIGSLLIDARLDEVHSLSNDVTQYPTEVGFHITDNVRATPLLFTMTGMITNAPIDPKSIISDFGENRAANAYDELLRLYYGKEIVSIQTTLELYDDMIISNLNIPKNSSIGDELRFTATFKQIIKARTEFSLITIEDVSDSDDPNRSKRAVEKANEGTKNAPEAETDLLIKGSEVVAKIISGGK